MQITEYDDEEEEALAAETDDYEQSNGDESFLAQGSDESASRTLSWSKGEPINSSQTCS